MKPGHPIIAILCVAFAVASCKKPAPVEERPEPAPVVGEKPAAEEKPVEAAPEDPPLGRDPAKGVGGRKAFQAYREGTALMKKKKGWEKSRAKLEEALEIDPELPEAVYNLARVECRSGEIGACKERLNRALQLCFPCFVEEIAREPDFDALREAEEWGGVQQAMSTFGGAWKRALSSPGAFLIVGISRLTPGWGGDGKAEDESSRGVPCFYHHGSGRLLPLVIGQNAAGFLLEGKRIHILSYGTIDLETDMSPEQMGRLVVQTVDLEALVETRARIPGSATSAVLHVREGVLHVGIVSLDFESGDETWRLSTFEGGKLSKGTTAEAEMTPTSIDPVGGAFERKFCAKRVEQAGATEPYLMLDAFCRDVMPAHVTSGDALPGAGCTEIQEGVRLCHEKDGWGKDEKLTLVEGDAERVLLEAPGFVQIDVRI